MFPHLAKEMEEDNESSDEHRVQINSVRSNPEIEEKVSGKFGTYMPDAIDFIRRCDNEKQAKEIIDYLEKRGEITPEYARKLRKQLKKKGVRALESRRKMATTLNKVDFQLHQAHLQLPIGNLSNYMKLTVR